jgi:hypothetical protein
LSPPSVSASPAASSTSPVPLSGVTSTQPSVAAVAQVQPDAMDEKQEAQPGSFEFLAKLRNFLNSTVFFDLVC